MSTRSTSRLWRRRASTSSAPIRNRATAGRGDRRGRAGSIDKPRIRPRRCVRGRMRHPESGLSVLGKAHTMAAKNEQIEVGQRLRSARETLGLVQEDVASALRIPRTSVISMEAGKRNVSALELRPLRDCTDEVLPGSSARNQKMLGQPAPKTKHCIGQPRSCPLRIGNKCCASRSSLQGPSHLQHAGSAVAEQPAITIVRLLAARTDRGQHCAAAKSAAGC